mmetsp:Transcript_38057/g.113910  ORF Transcript_38057/g.113910 Transcript_38057/m.113910 type:complete len:393 (+) Transcript_38057:164-1342(+)
MTHTASNVPRVTRPHRVLPRQTRQRRRCNGLRLGQTCGPPRRPAARRAAGPRPGSQNRGGARMQPRRRPRPCSRAGRAARPTRHRVHAPRRPRRRLPPRRPPHRPARRQRSVPTRGELPSLGGTPPPPPASPRVRPSVSASPPSRASAAPPLQQQRGLRSAAPRAVRRAPWPSRRARRPPLPPRHSQTPPRVPPRPRPARGWAGPWRTPPRSEARQEAPAAAPWPRTSGSVPRARAAVAGGGGLPPPRRRPPPRSRPLAALASAAAPRAWRRGRGRGPPVVRWLTGERSITRVRAVGTKGGDGRAEGKVRARTARSHVGGFGEPLSSTSRSSRSTSGACFARWSASAVASSVFRSRCSARIAGPTTAAGLGLETRTSNAEDGREASSSHKPL